MKFDVLGDTPPAPLQELWTKLELSEVSDSRLRGTSRARLRTLYEFSHSASGVSAKVDKLCQSHHSPLMVTMNISLPSPMKTWAEARAKDGRYSNTSDYVRDLIRKDQEREGAISELQSLIDEGLESGPARTFDFAGFIADRKSKPE